MQIDMTIADIRMAIQQAVDDLPQEDRECIARLRVFGSTLDGTAKPDSDIDLLIDLAFPVGFFTLARCEQGLQKRFQRKIDLRTPEELSHFIRPQVLKQAQTVYETS